MKKPLVCAIINNKQEYYQIYNEEKGLGYAIEHFGKSLTESSAKIFFYHTKKLLTEVKECSAVEIEFKNNDKYTRDEAINSLQQSLDIIQLFYPNVDLVVENELIKRKICKELFDFTEE